MNQKTLTVVFAILTVLAGVAGAGPALAQGQTQGQPSPSESAQPTQFEEQIEVSEVLLDVLVTDGRGNVVLGLGKDDFTVQEDGEPVDLNSVTFYSNREFLESAERAREIGVAADQVPIDRYFVLFFHDQRSLLPRLTAQILDAGRRAKQWTRSMLGPNDYVAVVSYDYQLKIFQDFTTDREAISHAIDQAVRGGEDPGTWPSRRPTGEGPSLFDGMPSPNEIRKGSERFYGAMELLAQATGPIQARKNVILFSLGFGEVRDFGFYAPDSRYYRPMIEELNDDNVAVYSIDLISIDPGEPVLENVYGNSLSSISADTGGRYYFNFVNFTTPLEQVARDNNGYYLLSYTSRHPRGESGYQEVTVETKNRQFRTRAREGYRYGEGP